MEDSVPPSLRPPLALRLLAVRGLVTITVALAGNLGLLVAVQRAPFIDPFGPLSAGPVTLLTVLTATAATAIYGVLTRIWPDPDWLFFRVVVIVLAVSFLPDLAILQEDPDATAGAIAVMMGMNVVVAAASVVLLTDRYSPIRR